MKKISHLVLLGEVIAICILHTIKINQASSETIPSATDKKVNSEWLVVSKDSLNTIATDYSLFTTHNFPLSLPDFTSFFNHTYG